jgi:WD40 repeat protein
MNLELLEASKDKLPDRVDATLSLPASLFQPSSLKKKKTNKTNNTGGDGQDLSAMCVTFNRRGNYAAVGYSNGSVAVFDVNSRTVCALYKRSNKQDAGATSGGAPDGTWNDGGLETGRFHLSWSRRSRSLLAGSSGEKEVRLIDTTHPHGPEECVVEKKEEKEKDKEKEKGEDDLRQSPVPASADKKRKLEMMALFGNDSATTHMTGCWVLPTKQIKSTQGNEVPDGAKRQVSVSHSSARTASKPRYPVLSFKFPQSVGGSLQVHPKDTCSGMAILEDGSLVAFHVPVDAWEPDNGPTSHAAKIASIHSSEDFSFTSASFDACGDRIYAATSSGTLVGFEVSTLYERLALVRSEDSISPIKPGFTIQVPGGASVMQVIVNRKGGTIILNSGDGTICLYSTKDCWTTPANGTKPSWVFHDSFSNAIFVSCDFSDDGRFVVAASNGEDNSYYLFIWNTESGELVDKLTGASLNTNSVAWHPARSFIAVAASDGLVDLWGPRVNWTAFAPSFQALTENIEYVECEDEFDIFPGETSKKQYDANVSNDEDSPVDVLAVEKIAAFASDSEDEEGVFAFETKVKQKIGLVANGTKDC